MIVCVIVCVVVWLHWVQIRNVYFAFIVPDTTLVVPCPNPLVVLVRCGLTIYPLCALHPSLSQAILGSIHRFRLYLLHHYPTPSSSSSSGADEFPNLSVDSIAALLSPDAPPSNAAGGIRPTPPPTPPPAPPAASAANSSSRGDGRMGGGGGRPRKASSVR